MKMQFYLDPMITMYNYMQEEVKEYLVSFGATVNHAVPAEGLGGSESLGTHQALVGTLPSVAPHMACQDRT